MTTAQTETIRTAISNGEPIPTHRFLTYCLETGATVGLAYGQDYVTGYVLSLTKRIADVQDNETGHIHRIAINAIHESVEA